MIHQRIVTRDAAAKKRLTPAQERQQALKRYQHQQKAEREYFRHLARVAKHVGHIIRGFAPDGVVHKMDELLETLEKYADSLGPWAKAVSARMIAEVDRRNRFAMIEHGKLISAALEREIREAPTGQLFQALLREQVDLIKSLPREAGLRVHKLTTKAMLNSTRANEVAKEIQRSGKVTENRAKCIARTEVARTASKLTEARARSIGSVEYKWHTVGDADVRKEHKKLNKKTFKWDAPPVAGSNGEHAHAGQIYNCRCWPEPILPDPENL